MYNSPLACPAALLDCSNLHTSTHMWKHTIASESDCASTTNPWHTQPHILRKKNSLTGILSPCGQHRHLKLSPYLPTPFSTSGHSLYNWHQHIFLFYYHPSLFTSLLLLFFQISAVSLWAFCLSHTFSVNILFLSIYLVIFLFATEG